MTDVGPRQRRLEPGTAPVTTPNELMLTPYSVWRHRMTGGLRVVLCVALAPDGGPRRVVYHNYNSGVVYAAPVDDFLGGDFEPYNNARPVPPDPDR